VSKQKFEAYKKTEVMTANRETVLLMLYAGVIRFVKQAIEAIEKKDIEKRNKLLLRSQEIVTELRSNLNHEIGGKIAESLDSLYGFVLTRLVDGNIKNEVQPLNEALQVLETLNTAWEQAISSLKESK